MLESQKELTILPCCQISVNIATLTKLFYVVPGV